MRCRGTWFTTCLLIGGLAGSALAATQNITGFGVGGWRSDDTRGPTGANLVGTTLTHFGRPGQTPTAADDIAIAQQLQFVCDAPGNTDALTLTKTSSGGANSKSTISTVNLAGFVTGDLRTGFFANYRYYANSSAEAGIIKIGVQSTLWGTGADQSQQGFSAIRSGESTWDIVLVDWRGTNPGWTIGAWDTFTTDADTVCWKIFRQAGNLYFNGTPPGVYSLNQIAALTDVAKTIGMTDYTWGDVLFGGSAKVTNVQFGVGSSPQNSTTYIDWVDTSLLNGGDRVDFGNGPVHNVTQGSYHCTIQAAVNAASAGDLIEISAGTYTEQVIVNGLNNLTLRGIGSGSNPASNTIIRSPSIGSMTPTPVFGGTAKAIVSIQNCIGVTIDNLRVDGNFLNTCGSDQIGISYWEAGGTVEDAVITNVRDNPISGCQDGVALHADNLTAGPFTLNVTRTALLEYQKNGTAFSGPGRTITMTDCTVTGAGPTAVTAQNGVQIGFGSSGTLTDCTISGHFYTGPTYSASGVLPVLTSGTVSLNNCDLLNNQVGYLADTTAGGTISGCEFRNPTEPVVAMGGFNSNGIFAYTNGAAVNGPADFSRAQPYNAADRTSALDGGVPMTLTIENSQFIGSDAANTVGIWTNTQTGGTLTVEVENCLIRDWDTGIYADEDGGTLNSDVHHSSIASNVSGGFNTSASTTTVQGAMDNYWGAPDGPSDPLGTVETDGTTCPPVGDSLNAVGTLGNGVSDDTVAYCPWLDAPATISLLPMGGDICYVEGETITVELAISGSKAVIVGAQAYLAYDTTRLEYLGGDPAFASCDSMHPERFCTEIIDFEPAAGRVFYSVGVDPAGGTGTADDTVVARLRFRVRAGAPATCGLGSLVSFAADMGALQTKLSDSFGSAVAPLQKNPLPAISVDAAAPVIDPVVVVGGSVDGMCQRTVTFSTTINDGCCIVPAGVSAAASITGGAATLSGFMFNAAVVDGDTVTVSGSVVVSAVTSCPVAVQITVNAADCCGIAATPVSGSANVVDDSPPTFAVACPLPAISVSSDANTGCGAGATFVNPTAPAATDNCDTMVAVVGTRSDMLALSAVYPVGTTTITWTATDECGNSATCTQDVVVSGTNVMNVTVELSPTIVAGPITRCITFRLYDCSPTPSVVEIERVITFSGGVGTDTFTVPCGNYECVTARDKRHTLRSTATPTIMSGAYNVSFTGARPDETLPGMGNRLLGGNLNDDFYIDILDFGVYTSQFGTVVGASTTCATAFPHADINGDGIVSTPDFTFILSNFLDGHQPNCCALLDGGEEEAGDGPILSITVKELIARDMEYLVAADLNADGVLDVEDIGALLSGTLPQPAAPTPPGRNAISMEELKRLYQENVLMNAANAGVFAPQSRNGSGK